MMRFLACLAIAAGFAATANAQTWNVAGGGSWASAANWTPATVPNAVGAVVNFGNSPAMTMNRAITNDSGVLTGFTVGVLNFDLTGTSTFTNQLTTGTASSRLAFDNGGAGVSITTTGTATGNNTIVVGMILNDNITAFVNQTTSTSTAGSLNLTGSMSGPGGFTKSGDGLATFGTGAKTYAGATILNGGRLRMSTAASATGTSSFTIDAGGQLTLISTAGSLTLGSGPLNLNGAGPTTGPFAAFPGAIRPDTNVANSINNPVVLQTNSTIHMQGAATGALTFTNTVSGPGRLIFTAANSNADIGMLLLNVANTYEGGTFVRGGTLVVNSGTATLGIGNVDIDNSTSVLSNAVLSIPNVGADVISDMAILSLGGSSAKINLGAGVNEVVGMLFLASIMQPDGTYGATGSGAANINDTFFTGTGIITVIAPVPEPAAMLLVGFGVAALARRRRTA